MSDVPSQRRPARWIEVLALVAAACAASVLFFAIPSAAENPTTAPVPTTHTYDDGHSGSRPEGSGTALWILLGAATCLTVIAVTLAVHGRTQPRH